MSPDTAKALKLMAIAMPTMIFVILLFIGMIKGLIALFPNKQEG